MIASASDSASGASSHLCRGEKTFHPDVMGRIKRPTIYLTYTRKHAITYVNVTCDVLLSASIAVMETLEFALLLILLFVDVLFSSDASHPQLRSSVQRLYSFVTSRHISTARTTEPNSISHPPPPEIFSAFRRLSLGPLAAFKGLFDRYSRRYAMLADGRGRQGCCLYRAQNNGLYVVGRMLQAS